MFHVRPILVISWKSFHAFSRNVVNRQTHKWNGNRRLHTWQSFLYACHSVDANDDNGDDWDDLDGGNNNCFKQAGVAIAYALQRECKTKLDPKYSVSLWRHRRRHQPHNNFSDLFISDVKINLSKIFQNFQNWQHFEVHANFFYRKCRRKLSILPK